MNYGIEKPGPNGRLPLALGFYGGFLDFSIVGGPFDAYRPSGEHDFGVCVRAERVPSTADVSLPINDFSVPPDSRKKEVEEAIKKTLDAAMGGKRVWVGCMGGWGRTGMFFALVAKVCGERDPVGYVREHYSPRAVETDMQKLYVEQFDVAELQRWLFWRSWTIRGILGDLLVGRADLIGKISAANLQKH